MKFVIVTAARSVSTYLAASLHSHPDVFCHGEVFNSHRVEMRWFGERNPPVGAEADELDALRRADPDRFLDCMFADGGGKKIVGFKLFDAHTLAPRDKILADPSIAKVVLERPNVLARYASLKAARATGNWQGSGGKPPMPFYAGEFTKFLDRHVAYYDSVRAELEATGQKYARVEHADMASHATLDDVLRFVGATTPLEELVDMGSPPGSSDIVSRFSNPADVTKFLAARGLERFANESAGS